MSEWGGSSAVASLPRLASPPAERTGGQTPIETGSGPTAAPGREPDRILRLAAERRVERFLDGFGMARGRRRDLVIQSCVAEAVARWREQPQSDLGALALEHAEDVLNRWFTAVLGPEIVGDHPPLLIGRAAFAICSADGSWPGVLSTCDRLPPAALAALARAGVLPTPAEEPGSMLEQQLEWWSAQELLTCLCSFILRLGRGVGGRAAPVA